MAVAAERTLNGEWSGFSNKGALERAELGVTPKEAKHIEEMSSSS